jgi:hypothetical protein
MKQFIKNFLIGLCLAPIAIVIACVMISLIFIMMYYVHSECIQGLLLLVYMALLMALLFAAIVSTINKLSKNNKELRDKIKNNYGKSL